MPQTPCPTSMPASRTMQVRVPMKKTHILLAALQADVKLVLPASCGHLADWSRQRNEHKSPACGAKLYAAVVHSAREIGFSPADLLAVDTPEALCRLGGAIDRALQALSATALLKALEVSGVTMTKSLLFIHTVLLDLRLPPVFDSCTACVLAAADSQAHQWLLNLGADSAAHFGKAVRGSVLQQISTLTVNVAAVKSKCEDLATRVVDLENSLDAESKEREEGDAAINSR
eukprot:5072705-Prymnesium_polylepis.1